MNNKRPQATRSTPVRPTYGSLQADPLLPALAASVVIVKRLGNG